MIPHFPNAWLWLGGWDFKYIEGGGRALQAQATVATSTGCCVVSSRTKERPGLWKPSMKEYLKEDTAAGEYTGVGSQSLGIAALSWEPWQAFSGCPMIIFKCRKHPSVCMMKKKRGPSQMQGDQLGVIYSPSKRWFGSVKGGAVGGNGGEDEHIRR